MSEDAHEIATAATPAVPPINQPTPTPTPIEIAQAEYAYWRQFLDHEHEEKGESSMGAVCAVANIVGGLIKKQIKPKDDHPVENLPAFRQRMYNSESILVSGALQYMINQLRDKMQAAQFTAAANGDIHEVDRIAEGKPNIHPEAVGLETAIGLLDEFEAHLNSVLMLLPDPTRQPTV